MSQIMESLLRNNYTTTQSVDYRYDIYDSDNNLVYHYPTTGPTRNDEIPSFDGQNFSYSFDSPSAITVGVNAFPTSVNNQITDSVTQANVKVLGDAPAMAMGNLFQATSQALSNAAHNATTAQQQTNVTAQAATTMGVTTLYSIDTASTGKATSAILGS